MWDLIPCYQIHALFILAPIKNGILLIDQHAAHERILFEQAMEHTMGTRTASQQLLFPIVVELTSVEKTIIESGIVYFEQFGFEIADFGGNSVSVSAIPAFLKDGLVETTLRDMVKYLLDGNNPGMFNEPQKRFAAAFACGAAIKAGQKLTQEEMNALLNNLFASDNPYICPHGRPTLVRMSLDELSRRFLR
jgi:DNA mismatch repair protein MutL